MQVVVEESAASMDDVVALLKAFETCVSLFVGDRDERGAAFLHLFLAEARFSQEHEPA